MVEEERCAGCVDAECLCLCLFEASRGTRFSGVGARLGGGRIVDLIALIDGAERRRRSGGGGGGGTGFFLLGLAGGGGLKEVGFDARKGWAGGIEVCAWEKAGEGARRAAVEGGCWVWGWRVEEIEPVGFRECGFGDARRGRVGIESRRDAGVDGLGGGGFRVLCFAIDACPGTRRFGPRFRRGAGGAGAARGGGGSSGASV